MLLSQMLNQPLLTSGGPVEGPALNLPPLCRLELLQMGQNLSHHFVWKLMMLLP